MGRLSGGYLRGRVQIVTHHVALIFRQIRMCDAWLVAAGDSLRFAANSTQRCGSGVRTAGWGSRRYLCISRELKSDAGLKVPTLLDESLGIYERWRHRPLSDGRRKNIRRHSGGVKTMASNVAPVLAGSPLGCCNVSIPVSTSMGSTERAIICRRSTLGCCNTSISVSTSMESTENTMFRRQGRH